MAPAGWMGKTLDTTSQAVSSDHSMGPTSFSTSLRVVDQRPEASSIWGLQEELTSTTLTLVSTTGRRDSHNLRPLGYDPYWLKRETYLEKMWK